MEIRETRRLLEEDYRNSLDYKSYLELFDLISSYLIETKSSNKEIKFREELFSSLVICFCFITDKGHILSSAYFEPVLQKVFKKLSEEDIWEEYETESYSSKQDLSLLQAYINGLCLFDKESYEFPSIQGWQSSSSKWGQEEQKELFKLNKKYLLQYLSKRSHRSVYSLPITTELMYQLELTDKSTIFKYMKGYLLHYEEFSSPPFPVCELLRDDELKEKAINFLIEKLRTNKRAVEIFLYAHLLNDERVYASNDPNKEFMRVKDLEPLCSNYLDVETECQRLREQKIFSPSDIDKNKTRFEIVVEISFLIKKIENYQATYSDPKDLVLDINSFLDRFFKNENIRKEFLNLCAQKCREDDLWEYKYEEIIKWVNGETVNCPRDSDFMDGLDLCLEIMRNYYGYELRKEESVNLEQLIQAYRRASQ